MNAGEAQQDPPDDRLVSYVPATGDQGGEERLPLAVGDPRAAPGQQHHGQHRRRPTAVRAKTGGTPQRAITTPARAGPAARATLTLTMSSRVAAASSLRGTSSVISGCQVGDSTACAGADGEGEGEQQGRGHHPGGGEHGEQDRHHDEVGLHAEHQPAAVERVGQHARRQGEQHHRQRAGGLHQGDDGGRVGVVDEQPLRADRLGPHADTADHHAEPEPEERAVPERRPGRDGAVHHSR